MNWICSYQPGNESVQNDILHYIKVQMLFEPNIVSSGKPFPSNNIIIHQKKNTKWICRLKSPYQGFKAMYYDLMVSASKQAASKGADFVDNSGAAFWS